jgi:hypothetical protein
MATYDYPVKLKPESIIWTSIKSAVQSRSPITGATEVIEFPAERWGLSINLPVRFDFDGGEAEAFFSRIAGGVDRVHIWNFMRPIPLGTMRGTPTIAEAAVRGQQFLKIAANGSLKAGDFFQVRTQLFQCFMDCESVAGVITVPVVHRVRSSITVGSAVAWDRPTALFVMPGTSSSVNYGGGVMQPITIDLLEVYK